MRDVQFLRAQKHRDQLLCGGGVLPIPLELRNDRALALDVLQSSSNLRVGVGEMDSEHFPIHWRLKRQAAPRDRLANSGSARRPYRRPAGSDGGSGLTIHAIRGMAGSTHPSPATT